MQSVGAPDVVGEAVGVVGGADVVVGDDDGVWLALNGFDPECDCGPTIPLAEDWERAAWS